jgi:DNA repair protein RecO (recombination protein O)
MIHKTKGIVLRSIRYGETSLVVTVFTELFGVQTYMVNGVRTTKKAGSKAAMFQPSSMLEMEVYHNEQKAMHRIKECSWSFLYKNILSDVVKNSIALFMIELIFKTLKQPEQNNDLFYFCEDALQQLDEAPAPIAANFPLYFSLQLMQFFGFHFSNIDTTLLQEEKIYLDLQEGMFTNHEPPHLHFMEKEDALLTSELLKIMQPHELNQVKMSHHKRRALLLKYMEYYALHIHDFGQVKTLPVLHEVLGV